MINQEHQKVVIEIEQKYLQMMEERDRAIQERNQVFNEMQRTQAESQMKENRIANLNEIVNSKEVLIERLSGEASQVS